MLDQQFDTLGMVARWRPVHLGQAAVLRSLCGHAGHVLIGIGSSNRYNARNPFTLEETEEMLRLALEDQGNYSLIPVPDLGDGPRWRLSLLALFGKIDALVTENLYVAELMKNDYCRMRPVDLVPVEERMPVDGSMIRLAMARGEPWQHWVPDKVRRYIEDHGLDVRFRDEFGLETLAMQTIIQ